MATIGGTGADHVIGELELSVHYTSDIKEKTCIDVEENKSANSHVDDEEPEPVTTRWELWAWYAYYFGNNSAGTLSYAPLSMSRCILKIHARC